jgi:LEA14-like dessication related protein
MASLAAEVAGGIVGLVVVLGVVAGGLIATGTFAQPTVESTSYQWGDVTNETTAIETAVVVDNPNPVGVPGVVDISYRAALNDVTLAESSRSGIGFGTGQNTIELTAQMHNDRIPAWWVTHVNGDEESQLNIDATVSAPGYSREIPAKSSTIETDILSGFATEETRTVTFRDGPFLEISDQQAEWGTADAETTPIEFSSTIENVHNHSVTLDGVEYVVRMNGVELGHERTDAGFDIQPGETGSLDVTVQLDTARMRQWWAAHVRDDEVSDLSVEMYGLVEHEGERQRLPLRFFDRTLRLETGMLGSGETSVEALPQSAPADTQAAAPTVGETSQEWGEVTDETTEIATESTLTAPEQEINDLMEIRLSQRTTINGVEVARGGTTISDVTAGTTPITVVSEKDNSEVPEWWARHVNNGERSQVITTPQATADVQFTQFDVDLDRRTSTSETDMLAGMNGDRNEQVTANGQTVATVTDVSSTWGQATPQVTHIDVEATIRNEQPTPLTITQVEYVVRLNEVTLADRTVQRDDTIPGGTTQSVPLTMELDSQQMDEWWVQHVRDDERSRLNVTAYVTVENRLGSERVRLDSLGQDTVVETDMLGGDEG